MLTIVDAFCGGGGTSEGIRRAFGYSPAVAINHNPNAIRIHSLNHPDTDHMEEDVFEVVPWVATRGAPIDLLCGSPSCVHFSVARGAAPRDTGIRSQADLFARWAETVAPRVMVIENVAEFIGWGPLREDGMPDKDRKGEYFRAWLERLRQAGYTYEYRILQACDFGAPTSRRRFFMVARTDGQPIRWPEPTHGPGRSHPHRVAADCIDWDIPVRSIFERKRPLAEATLRRIAAGVQRFVLANPNPFLLCITHGGRLEPLTQPTRTITTAKRGERALVVPTLAQIGYGERDGQAPRVLDMQKPLGTVVAGASKVGLVATFLAKHYTGVVGAPVTDPVGTVTTIDHHALVEAHLTQFYGTGVGKPLSEPTPSVTAQGQHTGLVSTFLSRQFGNGVGRGVDAPAPTITAGGGGKSALVAAFLAKYYGSEGQAQPVNRPMDTVTTKGRFGLVTAEVQGEPYVVTDIGVRMLEPRELARAQGFPDHYVFTGSKADQIAAIGNAVVPHVMEAILRANFPREASHAR